MSRPVPLSVIWPLVLPPDEWTACPWCEGSGSDGAWCCSDCAGAGFSSRVGDYPRLRALAGERDARRAR